MVRKEVGMGKHGKIRCINIMLQLGLVVFLLTGCGKQFSYNAVDTVTYDNAMDMKGTASNQLTKSGTDFLEVSNDGEVKVESVKKDGRKLIKTVDMNVETQEYDALLQNIEEQINALSGYLSNLSTGENGGYESRTHRYATLTAKIPEDQIDFFVNKVSNVSNVVSKNESVEDVTLQYTDLESHKKILTAEQERLLSLMEQADTVEDIISIESRLSTVRYELDSMESQIRVLNDQISYSQVTIYIEEVSTVTPIGEKSAWDRISSGFLLNIKRIIKAFKNFFIEFIIFLPVLVVIILVLFVLLLILRLALKKKKQVTESKKEEKGIK